MYERLNRSHDNALAYRIREPLSKPEMQRMTTELEGAIAAHGKIRVLLDLKAFPYAGLGSLWEDLKFDIRYLRELERFALVGGNDIEEKAVTIFGKLSYTRCRCFADDQLEDAWEWLIQNKEQAGSG